MGVVAGFAPFSVGSETDGSVVQPATRAALYGLKASHGSTEVAGVLLGALSFDCLGGFAKTPADLASLMSVLVGGDQCRFCRDLTLEVATACLRAK